MIKRVLTLLAVILIAGPVYAQDDVRLQVASIALKSGLWVDRSIVAPLQNFEESAWISSGCHASVWKPTKIYPKGLVFGPSTSNRAVFIFVDEAGKTVYKDIRVGESADKLGEVGQYDPHFAECAKQAKSGFLTGLPREYESMFRGFHGIGSR